MPGYRVKSFDVACPNAIGDADGRLWSVDCSWDYFTNARHVCNMLDKRGYAAFVTNAAGKVIYKNDKAKASRFYDSNAV